MTAQTHDIEVDSTTERLPARQLAELGLRVFAVLDHDEALAPVSHDRLVAIATGSAQPAQYEDLMAPLAAWIDKHHDELARAYPGPMPPFDHLKGFWPNFYDGPRNGVPFPPLATPPTSTRILDLELTFPFGVPSCALTPQSRFIQFFAERGFDFLTYKTVRDRAHGPHPFPQWAFAPGITSPLLRDELQLPVLATLDPGAVPDTTTASLVNSFGVSSLSPEQWQHDVERSKALIKAGQILMVSVMGSPDAPDTKTRSDLVRQYVEVADHASVAGADILEINLSCLLEDATPLCEDFELCQDILRAVRGQVETPVFIKISYLEPERLAALITTCQSLFDGVVAINAVPVHAVYSTGEPFFPGRASDIAALSGVGIRDFGLAMTEQLAKLRGNADWIIVGIGGVMAPADYRAYRDRGADVVQSCSGAWLDHFLAAKIRADVLGVPRARQRQLRLRRLERVVIDAIQTGGISFLTPKE
jgi:dihydroorotate dehydrogenase (NAD+) catalytic subunit